MKPSTKRLNFFAAGAFVALFRFMRKPTAHLFLLLAFSATVAVAVILITLRVASYAQVKAFYGLAALVPLCGFAAMGWDAIARRNRFLRFTLGALVILGALNSFASFWIVPSAQQHVYAGQHLRLGRNFEAAYAEAIAAVHVDLANAAARSFHAATLNDLGRANEAWQEAQRAEELNRSDDSSHLQMAVALAKQHELDGAISEARRAIALGPENAFAFNLLVTCLAQEGKTEDAIAVARDALALVPSSAELHYTLGDLATNKGDLVAATTHFGYAILLRPSWDEAYSRFHSALNSIANSEDPAKYLREAEAEAADSPKVLTELASLRARYPDGAEPKK